MRTICEMLAGSAEQGQPPFEVRCLATTATEAGSPDPPLSALHALGIEPAIDKLGSARIFRLSRAGVEHALLDTGAGMVASWEPTHGGMFDRLLDDTIAAWRPDILFTFGGQPAEAARRARVRAVGAAVVFGLRNHGYLSPTAFENVDAVITPSAFMSREYEQAIGLISTPMPVPIAPDEVLAPDRQPTYFTYVNPTPAKGVMFFARLAEEISRRNSALPILVVESRGTSGTLVRAGLAGGFDLRRHRNIITSPGVSEPRQIFAAARAILAPSVWDEPSGRVAAEALVNEVPPIVSDRGGLPETVGDGGFVLPLPPELRQSSAVPVPPHAVDEWAGVIERMAQDEAYYRQQSRRAALAGQRYAWDRVQRQYVRFFRNVRRGPNRQLGPLRQR